MIAADRRRPRRLMCRRLAGTAARAGRPRVSRRDGGGPLLLALLLLLAPFAHAATKIHPSALREAAHARDLADLNVIFSDGVSFEDARDVILAAGGSIDASRFIPSQRIEAKIPPAALESLASDKRVLAIVGPCRFKIATDNAVTAQLSHVTEVHAAPYGLTGAGVAVSLFELGEAQTTHGEFGGRLLRAPTTIGGTSGDRRHATHTSGTIGASGVRASAKGMAPAATIHQFCVRDVPANACEGNWLTLKDEKLSPLNVIADNNSWGWILGWQDGARCGTRVMCIGAHTI